MENLANLDSSCRNYHSSCRNCDSSCRNYDSLYRNDTKPVPNPFKSDRILIPILSNSWRQNLSWFWCISDPILITILIQFWVSSWSNSDANCDGILTQFWFQLWTNPDCNCHPTLDPPLVGKCYHFNKEISIFYILYIKIIKN